MFAIEGGAHTIEKGTQQFGVQQFGSYCTLCLFARFFYKIFTVLFVQGILINPIIKNRIFLVLRFFKPLLLHMTQILLLFKLELLFESKLLVALFGLG